MVPPSGEQAVVDDPTCLYDRWNGNATRVSWGHIASTVQCPRDAAFWPVCLRCPREVADQAIAAMADIDRVEPFD
jgi:hypothetical protein